MSRKKARERLQLRLHSQEATSLAASRGLTNLQVGVVLAVGLAFCWGVASHWGPLNGSWRPKHWVWPWRDLGILKTAALLFVPFTLIAWVLRRIEKEVPPALLWLLLGLLGISNFLLQALGIMADPRGFELVPQIVASPAATSYFTDAALIQRPLQWLAHFHEAALAFHSCTHPPGPILFYYLFFKLFGAHTGALVGGCAVGLVGSAGVLLMYKFAGLWTSDQRAHLTAAAFYALLPALTVFFPEFDQVYPIISMLLIFCWVSAFDAGPRAAGFAFCSGAALFAATFFAYNLLIAGAFLAYYGLYWLWREKWSRHAWAVLLRASGILLGVFLSLHAMLWAATGYNPVASFRHALLAQSVFADFVKRPYAPFAMLDPYDFLLGAGMVALPVLLFHFQRLLGQWDPKCADTALTLIGVATILTLDLSGLLRGETARVWLFLQPLLVVPVALELSRLSWRWKLSIFAVQWLVLVCLKANMSFVNP